MSVVPQDVKELKLTENPAAKKEKRAEKGDGYIDMQIADYICPVSSTEMNGKYRYLLMWQKWTMELSIVQLVWMKMHYCVVFFNENIILS